MRYLFMIILLCGCTVEFNEIEYATEICKNNGGLKHIVTSPPRFFECNNGGQFDYAGMPPK